MNRFFRLVCVLVLAVAASGCYAFETMDGKDSLGTDGRTDHAVGGFVATAYYANQPHVFYRDGDAHRIRHAWRDDTWHFEDLDGLGMPDRPGGATEFHISASVFNDRLHVFYTDSSGRLRHTQFDGSNWTFEVIDGPGSSGELGQTQDRVDGTTATVDDVPVVFFRHLGRLRVGRFNGTQWAFETIDGYDVPGEGRIGLRTGDEIAAAMYDDRLFVFYSAGDQFDQPYIVRQGVLDGGVWRLTTLDSGPSCSQPNFPGVGYSISVTQYGGMMHVFYGDVTGNLRHAATDGEQKSCELLDGPSAPQGGGQTQQGTRDYNTTAVHDGKLDVWYKAGNGLRHALFDGSAWTFQDLDGPGVPQDHGQTDHSLDGEIAVVLVDDKPEVFYRDQQSASLRHALFIDPR
jgi:hypothetical protein